MEFSENYSCASFMCCMRSSLLKAQIVMFVFQVYDYVDLTFSYLQVYPALCTVELEDAEMKSMGTSNPGFAIAVDNAIAAGVMHIRK